MQADGFKDLSNIVQEMDISNLPARLPILRLVTGTASCTSNKTAEDMKHSEEAKGSQHSCNF